MKDVLLRFSAVCMAAIVLSVSSLEAGAQPAAPAEAAPSSKFTAPEELTQTELLKAYLQLREQLHATQLAIVNSRVEAEAAARTQAAAIAERVESIKATIERERERQQAERERQQLERERQELEAQRSNRMVLWIAAGFGAVSLVAMLLVPLFQLRALNRVAELATTRPPIGATNPLLHGETPGLSDQAVASSTQRLSSAIDRMEKRIMELEHTASSPRPGVTIKPASGKPGPPNFVSSIAASAVTITPEPEPSRGAAAAADRATWIAVLMNKARSLVSANKPVEAISCYDEILKLDAKHAKALIRKGGALEQLNRFEEAIECYERAVEADEHSTLAYLHKAAACNRVGRYQEAVDCFENALRVEDGEPKPARV